MSEVKKLRIPTGKNETIWLRTLQHVNRITHAAGNQSWACFSKVLKLFGRISDDVILFVFSKLRRLEARDFSVTIIFIPFTTYEKTSFTE